MNAMLQFRVERDLTQEAAAEQCKVSVRSWHRWEKSGGPRNPLLRERLRQLGVAFEEAE